MNYLLCWEENNVKRWEMVKEADQNAFLVNLLRNRSVRTSSIFVIPTNFTAGIWLDREKHKSGRVDFWNFFEDFGATYQKPVVTEDEKKILEEVHDKHSDDTKYGFIAPDGRYFQCCYQGHADLADRICFGIVETNNSEYYLETHGWCKIYKSLLSNEYSLYLGSRFVLTKEQMNTIIKLGLENAAYLDQMLVKD